MDFNIQPTSYVFLFGALGVLLVWIWVEKKLTRLGSNLEKNPPLKQWCLACLLFARLGLMVTLTGFVFAGFWWVWVHFSEYMSPGRLALYSLIIAPAPLLLPLSAKIICKLTGGSVDVNQVQGCYFLGLNLNNIVYTLFMSYMLTILTGGLAFFGLLGSGIWAFINFL